MWVRGGVPGDGGRWGARVLDRVAGLLICTRFGRGIQRPDGLRSGPPSAWGKPSSAGGSLRGPVGRAALAPMIPTDESTTRSPTVPASPSTGSRDCRVGRVGAPVLGVTRTRWPLGSVLLPLPSREGRTRACHLCIQALVGPVRYHRVRCAVLRRRGRGRRAVAGAAAVLPAV